MGDTSEEHDKPQGILLFIFLGVLFGALTTNFLSHLGNPLPYTVVVFFEGIIVGTLLYNDYLGVYSDSSEGLIQINAELFLFIFLPPLLFGEAMNLNWYHTKGALPAATILAGPGVLMGAFLMGGLVYAIFFPTNFKLSMLFGSITAATDPVSVVALLNELGASPKLTITIVGESLLNDGTGMVLFLLFYDMMIDGVWYSALKIFSFFVLTTVVSPLIGTIVGMCSIGALRSANRELKSEDITFQIAITVTAAYLSFFFAQFWELSGVLSCVFAGLILAWLGPPLILDHDIMHHVWSFLEWLGNTLIFYLAGTLYSYRALSSGSELTRFGGLVLLYVLLMVTRFIVVFALYPLISRVGHGCSFKDAIFISFAGLRGALAIALALIVQEKSDDLGITQKQGEDLFFYVGGIATLTLLINATTAKSLLLYLGLVGAQSKDKMSVMRQIRKRMRNKLLEQIRLMRKQNPLVDPAEVIDLCRVLRPEADPTYNLSMASQTSTNTLDIPILSQNSAESTYSTSGGISGDAGSKAESSLWLRVSRRISFNSGDRGKSTYDRTDLLAYVRTVFLEMVRVRYWHDIESGKLPRLSFSAQFLLYSVDVALDQVYSDSGTGPGEIDYEVIWVNFTKRSWLEIILDSIKVEWLPTKLAMAQKYLTGFIAARKEKRLVYMLMSFINAHESAQKKIHSFVGLDDDNHDSIHKENEDEVPTHRSPEELEVIDCSKRAVKKAKALLSGGFETQTIKSIVTKQTARTILRKEVNLVKGMHREGLLNHKDAEALMEEISEDQTNIEKKRKHMYKEIYKRRGSAYAQSVSVARSKQDVSGVISRSSFANLTLGKDSFMGNDSLMANRDFSFFEPLIASVEESENESASERHDSSNIENTALKSHLGTFGGNDAGDDMST